MSPPNCVGSIGSDNRQLPQHPRGPSYASQPSLCVRKFLHGVGGPLKYQGAQWRLTAEFADITAISAIGLGKTDPQIALKMYLSDAAAADSFQNR